MTSDPRLGHLRPAVLQALLALTSLLTRQYGVFAVEQIDELGISRQRLTELVRAGLLARRSRGVYRSTQYPDSWRAAWMADYLAGGPGVVVAGRAAAFLHDLRQAGVGSRPDLELAVVRGTRRRKAAVSPIATEVHLTPADIVNLGPWRVTSVAWTLCSLAYGLGVERFERAVDAAIAGRKLTIEELGRTATRFRHCTGMPVIREVLHRHDPRMRLTRSGAERLFLRALRRAGLPLPSVDVRVTDADGNRRYLDFAYEQWRIMIEIDVFVDHGRTVGRHHDGHRQNALVGGWTPLRFDELDLRYGMDRVIEDVRRTLRDAGAEL